MAPQVTLVHALSHIASHEAAGKERHSGSDKVCDSCLALAQLGGALPSRFDWVPHAHALPERAGPVAAAPALRTAAVFLARGPPLVLLS